MLIILKEQCRSQYDSIFKDFFGKDFFRKNIKYNKSDSFIDIYLTNDIENDDEYKRIFVNINNTIDIQKYLKQYPKYYSDYYNYSFLYKGKTFQEITYTCEFAKRKEVNDFSNKEILKYYNKLKSKEYISPKKALKIARTNGLKNICYQSLTNASFRNRNQDVWQIQDCSNKEKAKVIELNPKSGEVLTIYERYYEKGEKAAYWNLFNKRKE